MIAIIESPRLRALRLLRALRVAGEVPLMSFHALDIIEKAFRESDASAEFVNDCQKKALGRDLLECFRIEDL